MMSRVASECHLRPEKAEMDAQRSGVVGVCFRRSDGSLSGVYQDCIAHKGRYEDITNLERLNIRSRLPLAAIIFPALVVTFIALLGSFGLPALSARKAQFVISILLVLSAWPP